MGYVLGGLKIKFTTRRQALATSRVIPGSSCALQVSEFCTHSTTGRLRSRARVVRGRPRVVRKELARGLVRRTGPTSIRNYRQHHRQTKASLVEKLPPNHRLTEIQTTDKWQFGRRTYQCFCPKGTLGSYISLKITSLSPSNG